MGAVISDILPQAFAIALSPLPLVALILVLFGQGARRNGPAFMLGWVLMMLIVGGIVLMLADAAQIAAGGSPSVLAYVVELLLGLLFLFLAYRGWKTRPMPGDQPAMPAWMAGIESFSAGKSFSMAAVLSGTNIKNVGLLVSATLAIAQSGLTEAQSAIALVLFVALACLSVILPVLYFLIAGASAEKTLKGWKTWLIANNVTVMIVLFLILGAKLVGAGLSGLVG